MRLGIIGCGNMGEILLNSLIESSMFELKDIFVSEKNIDRRNYIVNKYPAVNILDNIELVKKVNILILAVKPQDLTGVLKQIASQIDSDKLIMSIVAGVKITFIRNFFKTDVRIIRVMPNTACFVKKGISALAKGKFSNKKDVKLVTDILSKMGEVVEVNEQLMDIVTAVSGSGPGYIAFIIDNLVKEAVEQGLNADIAKKLVLSTLSGTVQLLEQTKMEPKELIDKVASKGGTTEAALNVFNKSGLGNTIRDAIKKAALRAKELSQ